MPLRFHGSRAATAVVLTMAIALAGSTAPARAQTLVDGVEHLFGATNVHAITGHGGMSVGVSKDGDVTVLSWPNPSYADQLGYISSNALDAREQPRFGAPEGAGMFLGLLVEREAGTTELTWLRDRSTWTISQSYGPDDGANPVTTHESEELGLRVVVTDAVAPEGPDRFVRHVVVERDSTSPVTGTSLVTYANLSPTPTTSRLPELPIADWAYDGRNDFAAVWDDTSGAVLHFHPEDQRVYDEVSAVLSGPSVEWGPVGTLLQSTPSAADVADLAARLDEEYASGAYLALTTVPAPDQHQIGFDDTPFCDVVDELGDNILALPDVFPEFEVPLPIEVVDVLRCDREAPCVREVEGWTHMAEDALADLADGELTGNGIAADEVNEALRTPLTFDSDVAEASVVLAAGATAAESRAALDETAAPETIPDSAQSALDDWLSDKRVPTSLPDEVNRVARRSLINLRVGTVADNGAIVASISRQPPYGLDWPRDGAFFDVALDVSGQSELVRRRIDLYGQWQRDEAVRPTPFIDPQPPDNPDGTPRRTYPAAAWEMSYYADGLVGGFIRFEIDNVGFVIWTTVAHAGWEDDPEAYLREHWDTLRTAADLLTEWRDPETGLHAPAQEDDNVAYTQTLHGAITTFGGLEMASRAARLLGEAEAAARWEDRAAELRDAIVEELYREEEGYFVSRGTAINPGSAPTGASAWLLWPMQLLPYDDPKVEMQLRRDLDLVAPAIDLENEGGAYFLKNTLAGAMALPGLPEDASSELRDRLDSMTTRIAAQSTRGTNHFGEVMVVVEEEGEPRADQRVATPHLWEGTLFYLTAMALEDPDALRAYDEALPESRVPAPGERVPPGDGGPSGDGGGGGDEGGGGGCGCASQGGAPSGSDALVALVALVLARRCRPRGRVPD